MFANFDFRICIPDEKFILHALPLAKTLKLSPKSLTAFPQAKLASETAKCAL
jgi:hypothetical protein